MSDEITQLGLPADLNFEEVLERMPPDQANKLRAFVQEADMIVREATRRNLFKNINYYKPAHVKQVEAHEAYYKHRYLILPWGNQGGKTYMACEIAVATALGREPWCNRHTRVPPSQIMIAANDFVHSIAGDVIPYILELIPPEELAEDPFEKIHSGIISKIKFKNGSFILFMSYEQLARKFEGYRWDLVVFNEPPPRPVWIATTRGLMARRGKAIIAATLLGDAPWVWDELIPKCGVDPEYFTNFANIFDNTTISEDMRQSWIDMLTPEEVEARIHGKPIHLMGRIFPEWDPNIHIVSSDKFSYIDKETGEWRNQLDGALKALVVDPHPKKPFCMTWYAIMPNGDYIAIAEWPKTDFETCKESISIPRAVEIIREIEDNLPGGASKVIYRYMDPNFGGSTQVATGNTVEDEFANLGIAFITDFSNNIDTGHLAIRRRLEYRKDEPISATNRPSFYVMHGLANQIRSFSAYTWDPDSPIAKPRDYWKDQQDCNRYLCVNSPTYFNAEEEAFAILERRARLTGQKVPGTYGR